MTMAHYTAKVKHGLLLELPTEALNLHLKPGDEVEVNLLLSDKAETGASEKDPLIVLLEQWIAEAPTDPEEIRQAEAEIEEFKQNLNANRLATGDRPLIEDAVDAKLREWQEQDGAALMPDVPAQALFAEWAEEDSKMTEEEREAERVLWESIEQGLSENGGRLQLRHFSE